MEQLTVEVELWCPEMKISKTDDKRVRVTAEEPMRFTGTFSDGRVIVVEPVIIPPTFLDKQGLLHWLVRACIGETKPENPVWVRTELPAEHCNWSWRYFTMVAEPMPNCPTFLVLPSGEGFAGTVDFPEAKLGLSDMTVEEVTAKGTLTLVEPANEEEQNG